MIFKMKRIHFFLVGISLLLLVACAPAEVIPTPTATLIPTTIPTPIPLQAKDYVLQAELLENGCSSDGVGVESTNERVLELREDGAAYIEASGRIEGWQIVFSCSENPNTIVSVVNRYENEQGPILTLSREWHAQIWTLIDDGVLEKLPDIPALGEHQIVFRDPNGSIGIEFVFQNFYFYLTGTSEDGSDNSDFFTDLAAKLLARAKSLDQ